MGFGPPPWYPPEPVSSVDLLEARLVNNHGVKTVGLAYTPSGHLLQDVAALGALAALTSEFRGK